jgi:hypothetical protein
LFGARPGSTRRGERDELTHGLREVARVADEGLHSWRQTAVARLTTGKLMRGVRHTGAREGHSHLAVEPRVPKRATGRQHRGRSRWQPKVEDDDGTPARLGRWRGRAVLVQREATGERLATEREIIGRVKGLLHRQLGRQWPGGGGRSAMARARGWRGYKACTGAERRKKGEAGARLGFIERRREGERRPEGHKPLMAMAAGSLMAFKRGRLNQRNGMESKGGKAAGCFGAP